MPSIDDLIAVNDETVHPFFASYLEDEESYRGYFARKLDDLQQLKPTGNLLDVGCGAGFFLDDARRRGYTVSGLDLSPIPARYARETLRLDVTVGSVHEYHPAEGSLDIITMFQTIEHEPAPATLGSELFRMLGSGGVLVLTTPAADGLVARAMGKRWFGYRNIEHVSFFDKKSLRHLIEMAGFEVVTIHIEHGKRLTLKYVFNRLRNYYYSHRTSLSRGVGVMSPVVALLGNVPMFEPWAHLYAIARKP